MTLRRRLLLAFIGIAIAVLGIFGLMAFYISTEFSIESEIYILGDIAREKAAPLNRLLTDKTTEQVNTILATQYQDSSWPAILIDSTSMIVAIAPQARTLNTNQLETYFKMLPFGKIGGTLTLDSGDLMWLSRQYPTHNIAW